MPDPEYRYVNRNVCKSRRSCLAILLCFVLVAVLLGCLAFITPSKTVGANKSKRETFPEKPWVNMRLPDTIIPYKYFIDLEVDMDINFYAGQVKIIANVSKNTRTIIFHKVRLNISSVTLEDLTTNQRVEISKEFEHKPNEYYILQTRENLLEGKSYQITIRFTNYMKSDLSGFYYSYHTTPNKTRHKVASTFFSPISARKAFPCFDEPKFKAIFELTLSHSDKYRPLGNMPVATQNIDDGKVTTLFLPTVKMSTYIVCWVISDFPYLERKTKDRTIKTWSPEKDLEETRYALNISETILDYLEDYFSIPYPLEKLDIVAVPNFGPGAMENWGLITFRSERLLVNENTTSASEKQSAYQIMGHELVHQWFGNLATMKFWTDAWLKEGFANYVFLFLGNEIQPDMELMKYALNFQMLLALDFDAYATSHPISTKANTPDEIRQIFDTITYQKGSSIVQMLHNYLGKENFRKGLQKYLTKYSYANADQDDLWRALSEESKKPVKSVMDTWTLQLGYPVVTVTRVNKTHYHLHQKRFSLDTPDTEVPVSPFNYQWKVPVLYRPIKSNKTSAYLLEDEEGYIASDDDVIINPDHVMYYRMNYDDEIVKQLREVLINSIDDLSVQDRTGFISDIFSMVAANLTHVKNAMDILDYVQNEYDYYPWKVALDEVINIYGLLDEKETRKKLQRFIINMTSDLSKNIGWQPIETMNKDLLQVKILQVACMMGDDDVIKNASKYFEDWTKTDKLEVPKNLRYVVRECAIKHGPVSYWNFGYSKYLKGGSEKLQILDSLAKTRNHTLLNLMLEWCLNPSKINSQDAPYLIGSIASNSRIGRELAWKFVKKNWDLLVKRYGKELFLLDRLLSSVLPGFSDEKNLKDVVDFFSTKSNLGGGKQAINQSITQIKSRIAWLKYNEENLKTWLNKRSQ